MLRAVALLSLPIMLLGQVAPWTTQNDPVVRPDSAKPPMLHLEGDFVERVNSAASPSVQVAYSPEPMALTRRLGGQVYELGLWNIRICAGDQPVSLPAERIYMASPVPFVGPNRARLLLQVKQGERWQVRAAQILGASSTAATGAIAGRIVRVKEGWIGATTAVGGPALLWVADRLRDSAPPFPIADLLEEPVTLAPGACAERVGFTPLLPRERVQIYERIIQ